MFPFSITKESHWLASSLVYIFTTVNEFVMIFILNEHGNRERSVFIVTHIWLKWVLDEIKD